MFARLPPPVEGLNPAQVEAVTYDGGPLLVVAGPGSGKTLTLAARVAHLVEQGVPPERILLLTFTRRAAAEMLARAERMGGRDLRARVWGGTFHSVGNRLLRLHGRGVGVRPDFTILDQSDGADLMDLVRGELGLGAGRDRFPRKDTLAAVYSRVVNTGTPLPTVLERSFPWCADQVDGIRDVLRLYTERKRARNLLDYDDLLLHWRALAAEPQAGERVGRLFAHVLVDEYQDTNALQADILQAMRRVETGVTVVGDDAQAIYGFRAATVRNILEFPARFPGTRIVRLEVNHRSTPPLVAATNAVIALAAERHEKTMRSARTGRRRPILLTCLDEAQQAEAVCERVLSHRDEGVLLRNQAVLFRASHHSDLLEVELSRRNIPFVKYGGLKFLEAVHVKDVLSLLRVLENPRDEVSWFRVLQLLDGVGPATARGVLGALAVRGDVDAPGPLRRLVEDPPAVPAPAREDLRALRAALADCLSAQTSTASQIDRLSCFLEPVFARRYRAAGSRMRDLEQLQNLARGHPSRARFLAELTLDPPTSTADLAAAPLLDEDYLVLSTMHSAKGLEWDVVHLIHAADGMIPSDLATGHPEEIEEERRLFYVALTRARDALHVYAPLRYYRRGRPLDDAHSYAQLSRFLPVEVRAHFDVETSHSDGDLQRPSLAVDDTVAPASVDAFLGELLG